MKAFKRMVSILLVLAMAVSSVAVAALAQPADVNDTDYTQFVKMFNGAGGDHGQLSPAAQMPNALMKLGADTWPRPGNSGQAGYDFNQPQIRGFSHTRIEGVGCSGAGGDVRLMPSITEPTRGFNPNQHSLYKANESAETGYYKTDLTAVQPQFKGTTPDEKLAETVQLDPASAITAEMTSKLRTGYHKYTFPQDNAYIYVDLADAFAARKDAYIEVTGQDEMSGWVIGTNVCGGISSSAAYKLYFTMKFSRPFSSYKTYGNDEVLSDNATQQGANSGAIAYFTDAKSGGPVYVKVTLSTISIAQAKKDMENEAATWDFDAVRAENKAAWQDILSRISIEDSRTDEHTRDLIEMFYTSLYRSFTVPVNATSTAGTYMGADGKIHDANGTIHYDCWSLWDDFRKYPIIGLIAPDVYNDIIRSISDYYLELKAGRGQYFPTPTVRYEHSITLLADGISKGYWDEDIEAVYEAFKSESSRFKSNDYKQKYRSTRFDLNLEYSYNDYCQAVIAKAIADNILANSDGSDEDMAKYEYYMNEYEFYLTGSLMYKNIWKSDADVNQNTGEDIGLFWSKNGDGSWNEFDPLGFNSSYGYEGSAWHWRWTTPHDVKGAAELAGGTEKMLEDLNYFFDNNWFTAVNETDLQAPYFFNYLGMPSKTQEWLHNIYTEETTQVFHNHGKFPSPITDSVYKNRIEAYPDSMDDDTGTMAAMYVGATMGIFPFAAGEPGFQIGSPAFEKLTFSVGAGKEFVIEAKNISRDNYYIQSASYNGEDFERTWIDYSEIVNGGSIVFEMGGKPSNWASNSIQMAGASEIAGDMLNDKASLSPKLEDTKAQPVKARAMTAAAAKAPAAPAAQSGSIDDYFAYWKLDGDLTDSIGGVTAVSSGEVSFDDGKDGKAVNINGTNVISDDKSLDFGENAFTAACWFKMDSTGNMSVIGKEDTDLNTGWGVRVDSGKLEFNILDNASLRVKTQAPAAGEWHHVAVTRDGGKLRIYLDGQLKDSMEVSLGTLTSTAPFRIGSRTTAVEVGKNYFKGLIDEIKLYNRALSDEEIAQLGGIVTDDYFAYWDLDGNVKDSVGAIELASTGDVKYDGGVKGQAIDVNGQQLTSYSEALNVGENAFTASCWFKANESGNMQIIGKDDTGADTGWSIRLDSGKLEFNVKDTASLRVTANTPAVGAWHHVAVMRDGDTVAMYLDGELVGTNNAEFGTLSSDAPFRIGSRTSPTAPNCFKGLIDEVKLYSRALSPAEIGYIFENTEDKDDGDKSDSLGDYMAYWMLDGSLKDVKAKYDFTAEEGVTYSGGKHGQAICVNGKTVSNESADFNFGLKDFAVSVWYNAPSTGNAEVIGKEDTDLNTGWGLRIDSGKLEFNILDSGTYRVSVPAPSINQWHHVVLTREGNVASMYIDGKFAGSNTKANVNMDSTAPLKIGSRTCAGGKNFFAGLVDDVRIYNRAVTAEEAAALYTLVPGIIITREGQFKEATGAGAESGVMSGDSVVTFTLSTGETWADTEITYAAVDPETEITWSEGDPAVKLYGVPEGLTPVFSRVSDNTIEMTLSGKALVHDGTAKDVVHVEINPAYILADGEALTDEDIVLGSTADIPVEFVAGALDFSGFDVTETIPGSGIIDSTIEVKLLKENMQEIADDIMFSCGAGGQLIVGEDIIVKNLPRGVTLTAQTKVDCPKCLELKFTGTATNKYDVDNIEISFNQSAFNKPGAVVLGNAGNMISFHLSDIRLWYSSSVLDESQANDGSIDGEIWIRATDVSFTANEAGELDITTQGLPDGLTAHVQYYSESLAKLYFEGKASNNELKDSAHFTLIFADSAFDVDSASYVTGYSKQFSLYFKNPALSYSNKYFFESSVYCGTFDSGVYAYLRDGKESFNGTSGEDFIASGKLTINGVPAGLTAKAEYIDSNTLYVTLEGKAASHTPHDNAECMEVIFSDSAFTGGNAQGISGSILNGLNGLRIAYNNAAPEFEFNADSDAYRPGDVITFTALVPQAITNVGVANENGRFIVPISKTYTAAETEGCNLWTITASVLTKGDRTFELYTADAQDNMIASGKTVDIKIMEFLPSDTDEIKVISYKAPAAAKTDEVFTITVRTSLSAVKVGIFNAETGAALGKISQSYVDKNGERVWTIALKVGTKGNRVFDIKAADIDGQWSGAQQMSMYIYNL